MHMLTQSYILIADINQNLPTTDIFIGKALINDKKQSSNHGEYQPIVIFLLRNIQTFSIRLRQEKQFYNRGLCI